MSLHHVCPMLEQYETCVVPRPRCLHLPNLHRIAETLGSQISAFLVSCPCWHTWVFGQVDPPREVFLSFSFPLSGNQNPTFLHVPYASGPCIPESENFPDGRRALRRVVPEAGAWGGGRVSRKPAGCPKRRQRRRILTKQRGILIRPMDDYTTITGHFRVKNGAECPLDNYIFFL